MFRIGICFRKKCQEMKIKLEDDRDCILALTISCESHRTQALRSPSENL